MCSIDLLCLNMIIRPRPLESIHRRLMSRTFWPVMEICRFRSVVGMTRKSETKTLMVSANITNVIVGQKFEVIPYMFFASLFWPKSTRAAVTKTWSGLVSKMVRQPLKT